MGDILSTVGKSSVGDILISMGGVHVYHDKRGGIEHLSTHMCHDISPS